MTETFAKEVTRQINSTIVMHPRFQRALNGILDIINTASIVDIPLGATVIGPSGSGKSALIKCIEEAIPKKKLLKDDKRSICITAEASSTVGHLVVKLMAELGYPTAIRSSTLYEQSALVAKALKDRQVIVVFIDESQHICRGKRTLSAAAITDWIKQLADSAKVVVVMLGTPELVELIEVNEQLGSRAPAYFELREIGKDEEWLGLLREIANACTGFDLSSIHVTHYKALYKTTKGLLRPLKQILIAGTMISIEAGKTALDKEDLAKAHERIFGNNDRNPNAFLRR